MNYANKKTNDLARRSVSTSSSHTPTAKLLLPAGNNQEEDGGKSRWKRKQNFQRGAILGVSTCLAALVFWIRPSVVFQQTEPPTITRSKLSTFAKLDCQQGSLSLLSVNNGTQNSHIVLTVTGQKGGSVNQDRSALWPCRDGSSSQHVFVAAALFDGHGPTGHDCAQLSLQVIPPIVQEATIDEASLSEKMQEAVGRAFAEADKRMQVCETAGTTALLLLLSGSGSTRSATLASAGDSTGLVVQIHRMGNASEYQVMAESRKHKAADPGERERIEEAGGIVWMPENDNDAASSRVLYPIAGGGGEMSLAMSRSLGDLDGKRFGVLTSEPSLVTVQINDAIHDRLGSSDETLWFAILASDGVFDVLDKGHVVKTVGEVIDHPVALEAACRALLEEAKRAWFKWTGGTYRDDMTLLVTNIE